MSNEEKVFLMILKDIIHPSEAPSELPSADWKTVLNIAKKQNLFALICDASVQYTDFKEFNAASPQYFQIAAASMIAQMQKTKMFVNLYQSFIKDGLFPIAVKGIICRNLYGDKGDFRPSGDEDILIEKKDYEKAAEILNKSGYKSEEQPDKGFNVIQEVTFHSCVGYGKQNLTIELHLNPFGTESSMKNKMNNWFKNVFKSNETILIQNTPIRTMEPTDNFLFLLFHSFKHFTGGGFGVRLMLDVLLFAEKYSARIEWNYVNKGLDDVGAKGFLADLMYIGNTYLGFEFSDKYKTVCPDELLEDMFRMGTFGNTTRADRTAGTITSDAVQEGFKKKQEQKTSVYIRLIFPSWETWLRWKPYLADKPFMLPVEWFKRMCRYIRGETSSRNLNEIDESYKIANDRIALLTKYKIV